MRPFYRNPHLLHRRFPASALVGGHTGAMLVLGQTHAVGTTETTTRRMLLRRMARQRDLYGHRLTEGQQPQRIVGRNHGREACGHRIAILDRFREEPRPHGQRKAVPVAYQKPPAPIDATDLLSQRLRQETPYPIRERIGKGMFRPAHTPTVHLCADGMPQPHPKSCRCQHRSVQTHGDLPSPSVEWSMAFSLEKPPRFRARSSSLGGPQGP
jgi:hypothetical protein